MAKIRTLRSHPLFSALTDRELALFSRIVGEDDYAPGTLLFAERMKSMAFYLVQRGKVGMASRALPGEGVEVGAGETFGQWALLGPDHLTAVTAKVLEESSLLVVRKSDFENFLQEEPVVGLKVLRALVSTAWDDVRWLREQAEAG